MRKPLIAALSLLLVAGAGVAVAQQDGKDGPPPSASMHNKHGGDWHKGHKGPHHPPPPASIDGKGFDLELGHGKSLRVQCGEENIQDCITAVQPLIDQLSHRTPPTPKPGMDDGSVPSKPAPDSSAQGTS